MRVTTQAAISRNKSDMSIVFTRKLSYIHANNSNKLSKKRWVLNQSRCRRIHVRLHVYDFSREVSERPNPLAYGPVQRLDAHSDGLTVLSWNDGVPCVVVHQLYTRAQLELELRLEAAAHWQASH